jgi:DNA-binding NtrC family response regulator
MREAQGFLVELKRSLKFGQFALTNRRPLTDNELFLRKAFRMPEKILLVEDHATSRANISRFLRLHSYEVVEVSDGEEALKLLATETIDLVVSDLALPTIHGLNLTQQINSKWPRVPVIIISAFISDEAGKLILDGKGEFLAKPLDLTVLASKVHQLLANR